MIDSSQGPGGAGGGSVAARMKSLRPAPPDAEKVRQQFREVSQLYEKHFMREMMKAMRATVPESEFIKQNQGEKIFRGQLDEEYVEKWGDRGGIGLSNLIYDQLVEKYGPAMGLTKPVERPKGPLPLDEKSNFPSAVLRPQKQEKPGQFHFDLGPAKNTGTPEGRELRAPWSGYLSQKIQLAPEEWALEIDHGSQGKSQLAFRGIPSDGNIGQAFQAGERIGLLSPDATQFVWSLRPGIQETKAQGLGLDPDSVSE